MGRILLTAWRNYQEEAAQFFRNLGLEAAVEKDVPGVRGSHRVDVLVTGSYLGISFTWVVECKAWKSNVSKEKVAALISIVQDVGADRGFLLSEEGFQSGALRMAERSNVTLTSLADLGTVVGDKGVVAQVASLHLRIHQAQERLRSIKRARYDDEFYPPVMEPLGKISLLTMAIDDVIRGELPTPYTPYGPGQQFANTLEEMLVVADRIISEAEAWAPPD